MTDLEQRIQELKVKKARQLMEIEMLSEINDSVYTKFGKTVSELMKLEKELVRETQNDLQ